MGGPRPATFLVGFTVGRADCRASPQAENIQPRITLVKAPAKTSRHVTVERKRVQNRPERDFASVVFRPSPPLEHHWNTIGTPLGTPLGTPPHDIYFYLCKLFPNAAVLKYFLLCSSPAFSRLLARSSRRSCDRSVTPINRPEAANWKA